MSNIGDASRASSASANIIHAAPAPFGQPRPNAGPAERWLLAQPGWRALTIELRKTLGNPLGGAFEPDQLALSAQSTLRLLGWLPGDFDMHNYATLEEHQNDSEAFLAAICAEIKLRVRLRRSGLTAADITRMRGDNTP